MVYLIVFLSIYAPVLHVSGQSIDTQAVFFLALISWTAVTGNLKAIFSRGVRVYLFLLLILLAYSFMTVLFFSSEFDTHAALRIIRVLITLIGCFSIIIISKRNNKLLELDKYIFFAITMHAVIMILQYVSPSFKDYIYQYTVNIESIVGARQFYSMAGLTNGGGAQLSVYQSAGVLLLPVLLSKINNFRGKILLYIGGFLCLVSVFISGRSGILSVLIFYPIIVIILNYRYMSISRVIVNGVSNIMLGLILIFLFSFVYEIILSGGHENLSYATEAVVKRTEALFAGNDGTSKELWSNHLYFPNDTETLFFGDPKVMGSDQGTSNRILQSDIGYIRILFAYGLVGSLLHYFFYIFTFRISYRIFKKNGINRSYALFSLIFTVVILLFNAKEVFVFTRMGLSITSLTLFAMYYQLNSDKNRYYC